uniref:Uncharacterized protein n=1 Tax=Glossina pallidipes TaxID=7398 RepID=A0A1A9ZJ80_GLOPL
MKSRASQRPGDGTKFLHYFTLINSFWKKNLKSFVLVSKAIALINGEQGVGGEVMFLDDFFSSMNIFGLRYTFTGQDPEHFSVSGLIEFHAVVDDSIVFVISTQNKVVGLVGLPWLKVMANLAGAA